MPTRWRVRHVKGGLTHLEQLGVHERQLNDLTQLANLLAQTTDTRKADRSGVLQGHVVHHGVDLAGEDTHDGESSHVQRDTDTGLELELSVWVNG